MKTLLLDRTAWDLVLDVSGNIAVASEPYSLAQDAASAIKEYLGEGWFDTTAGVPWPQYLVPNANLTLIKSKLVSVAKTVPGVVGAAVFISSVSNRVLSGQVQVTDATGNISAASF